MKTKDVHLPDMKTMRMSMIMIMMTRMMIRTAEEVLTETEKRIMMTGEIIAGMKGIITGRQQTGIMTAIQTGVVPETTVTKGTAIQTHHIQAQQGQGHMLVHPAGNQNG